MSKPWRRILVLMCCTLLLSAFGCDGGETAQNEEEEEERENDEEQEETNYGTITGEVTLDGLEDFSGVQVTAGEESAATDADGHYELTDLRAGDVEVTASFDGYIAQTRNVEVQAGESVEVDFHLLFENRPPVIESVTAVPGEFEPGETGLLTVEAYDPDGDELQYQWNAPEGWLINPDDEAQVEITAPNAAEDSASVEIVVTDGLGGEASRIVTVATRASKAPIITSLTAAPPQAAPGGEIELLVEADDPDGGELTYEWTAPAEWTFSDAQTATTTLTAPDAYGESAFIEMTASNEFGVSATAVIVVSTIENQGPQITLITADPAQIQRGSAITLNAEAAHPQNADLDYAWAAPSGWTLEEDGSSPQSPVLHAPDAPGESALITLTVTDPEGVEAAASVMVGTLANQIPVIESLTAVPPSVIPGEMVMIEASAYDPDGLSLSYEWDVPTAWTGSSSTNVLELTAPASYGQSAVVGLVVSDGIDTRTASITISTVPNAPPTISSLTASPATVEIGGTSILHVEAADPYGETLSYSWALDNNDWSLSATGDEATLQASETPGDSAAVTVTVDDGHGGMVSASVLVQTKEFNPPSITSFTATPQIVERGGSSLLAVSATDPSGGGLSYSWSHDNDDWSLNSNDDEAVIDAPDTPDDSTSITVTVTDSTGAEAVANITIVTASNQIPVISSLTADPSGWVERGATFVLTVDAEDPDGGALTYDWSAANGWNIVGNGAVIELDAPDANSSYGYAAVTVTDALGASATAVIDVRTQDITPDPFGFEDQYNVSTNATITSDIVIVDGFDGSVSATCSNCELSRNGGPFTSSDTEFMAGDTIQIQTTTGPTAEVINAYVLLGDTQSQTWVVTANDFGEPRVFTTCGQEHRFGPSYQQCSDEYDDAQFLSELSVINGVQYWTVPISGSYLITAYGAGAQDTDSGSYSSGRGAVIEAVVELSAGEQLEIMVGQQGTAHTDSAYQGVGGGGGTFIVHDNGTPLVIAGGGGGAGHSHAGLDASTGTRGVTASQHCDISPLGGKNGEGGDAGSEGGGGGGWLTDGEDSDGGGGESFLDGGVGGAPYRDSDFGGFGGGAGSHDSGGGGGGYSGGGGGQWSCSGGGFGGGGGGGGSYITAYASNVFTSDGSFDADIGAHYSYFGPVGDLGEYREGHGMVVIDLR